MQRSVIAISAENANARIYLPIAAKSAGPGDFPPPVIAPPTYTPYPTYTPQPTYTRLPTQTPVPVEAKPTFLPTQEPTIPPTPTSTSTSQPREVCRNVIQDGSFEAQRDGPWRKFGTGGQAVFREGFVDHFNHRIDPREGLVMGGLSADDFGEIGMVSNVFNTYEPRLTKAELTFYWQGDTEERSFGNEDIFLWVLMDDTNIDSVMGFGRLKTVDITLTPSWHKIVVDVSKAFNRREWPSQKLGFFADGDGAKWTAWYMDSVSLTVCTME